MKKVIALIVLVAVVAGVWFAMGSNKKAPEVTFTQLNGQQFKTENLKGKVTLVKFWATTCTTCMKQMPEVVSTYEQFKDQGYQVVAVAMSYDDPQAIQNLVNDRHLPFTIVYDHDQKIAKAFDDVRFTPVSFLIDRQGNIVKQYIGEYNVDEFKNTVQKTLAQQ